MDFSAVTTSVLSNIIDFWYLIPIILIVMFFKLPFGKDLFTKILINFIINVKLDKQKYKLFKNVILHTQDGATQINHIIVSQYGIFIIKTKNMKGSIFGDINQKRWIQKTYNQTAMFQNPLDQCYKHIKIIESRLNMSAGKIFCVIVFVGDNTLKTDMPSNVTYVSGFIDFIKSKTEKILSADEVKTIIFQIKSN